MAEEEVNTAQEAAEEEVEQPQEEAQQEQTEAPEGETEETEEQAQDTTGESEQEEGQKETKEADIDQLQKELDELRGYRQKSQQVNKEFMEVVQTNPELMDAIKDMIQDNMPADLAIAKHFDIDNLKPPEDDEELKDKWKKQREEFRKKKKEREEQIKKFEQNRDQTLNNLQEFTQTQELKPEQVEKFSKRVDQVLTDVYNGLYSKEFIELMWKGYSYDDDIKTATEAGEVKGKNEKIDEFKVKQQQKKKGDGTPVISGSEKKSAPKKNLRNSDRKFLEMLEGHSKQQEAFNELTGRNKKSNDTL